MNSYFVRPGYSDRVSVPTGSRLVVSISGTFTATVQVERFVTGNYYESPSIVHTFTEPGEYETEEAGSYRLHCSAYASGQVNYVIESDHAPSAPAGGDGAVSSVAGRTGDVTLTKTDVGLANVDNTSDANKPISSATQTALNAKAPLASPALTGTPTAPTAAELTNTTQIATTAFVRAAIAALVNASPSALDTLNELAAALGNDANFATTITNALASKAQLDAANAFTNAGSNTFVGPVVSSSRFSFNGTSTANGTGIYQTSSNVLAVSTGGTNRAQFSSAGIALQSGNFVAATAGQGLQIKEGTNAKLGVATLVGGTVTVNTTAVTANSRIFVTSQADGGTPGTLRVSARSAGTSFTITSSSGADTSTVAWVIVEPAP